MLPGVSALLVDGVVTKNRVEVEQGSQHIEVSKANSCVLYRRNAGQECLASSYSSPDLCFISVSEQNILEARTGHIGCHQWVINLGMT